MAFYIKQNDTSPALSATLTDFGGNPINLTSASVQLHMEDQAGTIKIDSACTITNGVNGIVQYDWVTGDTDTVGTYKVEFEVTYFDGTIETFPNKGYETVVVVGELN